MTDKELQEFWEGFGLHHKDSLYLTYPPIDLNNLFKYAREKAGIVSVHFSYGDEGVLCWVYTKKLIGKPFYGEAITEEDTLYQAIVRSKK